MSPSSRPPNWHYLLAGILVAVFMAQSFFASLQKSPVFDEPAHIAAGLSYIHTGVFRANLQHPPLLKEIAGVFLSLAGIHWRKSELANALLSGAPDTDKLEWPVGNNLIHEGGADRVLFWGRLPFILLGGLLGALIYWWGRELVGSTAALGALFLYAFDPTIIAHSALVTTDVGVTAFEILFLFALWRYIQKPDRKHLVLSGLALGAVLGTKFSAVFLLPSAALLMGAAVLWPIGDAPEASAPAGKRYPKVAPGAPCPCGSGKKYKKCHGAETATARNPADVRQQNPLLHAAGMFLIMCGIAAVVVEALYFFPSNPFLYIAGLRSVNADHQAGYSAYLHGELSLHFLGYFAVAFLLKEPAATVLLSVAGLVILLRRKTVPPLVKLFLLLTPFIMFAAVSILADNMGIRYIIPTLPFAYLLGGLAIEQLLDRSLVWGKPVAAILCLWVLVEAIAIYPDHLSYFNESACLLESPGKIGWGGGTRCGYMWLDDSNVDWGQGLKQLSSWLNLHGNGRTVTLGYFGEYPVEGYGLKYTPFDPSNFLATPTPGLYAISSQFLARMPGGAPWPHMEPNTIVGHAFYIYDVR